MKKKKDIKDTEDEFSLEDLEEDLEEVKERLDKTKYAVFHERKR